MHTQRSGHSFPLYPNIDSMWDLIKNSRLLIQFVTGSKSLHAYPLKTKGLFEDIISCPYDAGHIVLLSVLREAFITFSNRARFVPSRYPF